ncbi:hypothetical protein EYF80_033717 [Liparis tanakae]|uniref:Uncharacterized protein n=1 Tax=Liparis tanakae TaxID=230148 RepID=A0A4Z2GRI0_9TELE|nr:hypothetical protein EYF80_033717 [Liparis tanakae]
MPPPVCTCCFSCSSKTNATTTPARGETTGTSRIGFAKTPVFVLAVGQEGRRGFTGVTVGELASERRRCAAAAPFHTPSHSFTRRQQPPLSNRPS